jgi:hypothetical protein
MGSLNRCAWWATSWQIRWRYGHDGAVNGLAGSWAWSEGVRRLQTGLVRNYALAMLAGAVAVLVYCSCAALWGGESCCTRRTY